VLLATSLFNIAGLVLAFSLWFALFFAIARSEQPGDEGSPGRSQEAPGVPGNLDR
jgi:hypothetical protein